MIKIASVYSDGVWFAFQIFIIDTIVEALKSKNALLIAFTAAFYITLKRARER